MGDFNLSHLIAKLQQPSGPTQETVATWRQVLCQVVCDLVSKHGRLNKAQGGGDVVHDLQVELDLVLHTVAACPQLYAPSLLASSDDTPALSSSAPSELSQQEKHSAALISWLLSHLLSILGSGKCEEICVKVHEVILSMLHTVKARDPHPFYNIMVTVIGYLGELSLVHPEFYMEGSQDYTAELYWFPLEEDMVAEFGLPSAVITLKEPEECEQLQAAISKLLSELALDLSQFCWGAVARVDADKPQMLWATIGQQLQNGDLQLKLVTLELASRLLEVGELPSAPVTDYLLACLAALLGLLAAGYEDSEGDYLQLETGLGRCVNGVVVALSKPVYHLDAVAMAQSLLDKLSQVVVSNGLEKLRSKQLKMMTCNAIWRLYQLLPEAARSHQVAVDQRQELARHLVQILGTQEDVEHVTSCLVYLLLMEQQQFVNNNNIVAAGDDKAATTAEEGSEPGKSKGRKRKLSSKSGKPSLLESDPSLLLPHLPTLTLLLNKVTQLCQALSTKSGDGQPLSILLSGVSAVVQVTCWSAAWGPPVLEVDRPLPRTQSLRTPSKRQSSVSSGSVPLTCLRGNHLQQVCESWVNWFQVCTEQPALLREGYAYVVAAIGNFITIQDVSSYPPDVLQTFTWMLSLHWLPTEVSWLDLKPKDAKEVAKISSVLTDKIDESVLCDCIQLLALLPKEVATKWRSHVINAAMGDHREAMKAAAVQSFPQLLYHAGPNANHLVYDVLHPVLQGTSCEMKLAVANVVGPLACVVSRRAVLNRPEQSWLASGPLSFKAFKVSCSVCDEHSAAQEQASNKCDESWDKPKFVDPNMFLPFRSLLEDNSTEAGNIKLAFTKSLGRVFGHIGVRSSQGGQNSAATMAQSCLGLLQDPDVRVRRALSTVVSLLVSQDSPGEGLSPMDDLVLSHLHTAIKQANEANDSALIETLLTTVGHIGRVAEGDLFVSCIYSLLGTLCAPCCPLAAAVAIRQLKQMAQHRDVKLRKLFLQHARSVCKFLVECLHEAQRKHTQEPARILQEVAQVFQFDDVKSFLRRTEQYLLSHLVKKATNTASALIRFLAKQMGDPNHKVPIARNISHIYCHLVCSCQNEELLRTFSFLEDESGWELEMLLKIGQNVDSELLLHLASHYDKVLRGIKILASKTGPFKGSDEEITDENLGEMLQPKLLGILVHFDNHLNNATIPLNEKKEAYESVVSLISLMGPRNITTVRMRLMTTLRIGLRFQDRGFPELCCKAWNSFVRSLELSAVGPMLSQIILNLQPLLSKLPKQVATIYYYLLVENRRELSCHYHELYFLPEIPELAEVNAVLKQYLQSPDNQKDLRLHIRQLIKGIRHESTYVRQMALTKLKHQLHCNQPDLHKLIMAHETADPCISELVHVLLAGCRESDPTVRSLYGECLGELGAIDPGRLDLMSNRPKEEIKKFQASVTEDNFVFDLVNELAKAFLRAEDRNTQDCVAFSLQELIQIFSIRQESDPPSSAGSKLWARFSEDVQEILGPLTHSKYKLTMATDWSTLPRPIYRSKKGAKFEQWVSTFTGYLTSKVKEEQARKVCASCRGIVKNDSHIALYLLPHVTVQVLIDGDEQDQEQIRAEILPVLNHVRERDGRPGVTSDLRHLSAQTVFSVLDHLLKWRRHRVHVFTMRARAAGAAKGSRASTPVDCKYNEDPWYQKISNFLAKIPQDLLAYASENCEAYTRALMHLEQFLRPQTEALQQHLDFLQKLYVSLDEPDGVAGVTAIKQSQPTLGQQILAYESIGQLSDASVCYDRALQLAPNDLAFRQGLLRCRLQLGELDSAMELANGMIAERPAWGSSLNVYRVEAAWKLGQWDRLSNYLIHEENNRHWNLGLARLLLAAKHRDECEFVEQMGMLRNDLMGPLSAASMEVGSYHRGYDYITRLHMLTEIEQGVTTLLGMSAGENSQHSQASETALTAESLLKLWENRLDFTQSSYRTQEPLLNMRRTLLWLAQSDPETGLDKEVGQCWLQTAKVARKCGLIQTAHSSLLSASLHNLPEFCLENAKWLWDRGDYDKAQSCLEKAIEEHYPDRDRLKQEQGQISSERRACAQVLLQLAKYCEETASWESNVIMRQYKEATRINPHWEDGYFYIAKYYDKIMTTLIANDRPEKKGEFILHVVQNFGQSLLYGNQYIYQSMPRMLTLWLDYGAEVVDCEKRGRNEVALQGKRAVLGKLNQNMALCTARLPPYQFLTAFPQLISRICHTHDDVFAQLKELIAKLLVTFPQQCVWMMMAVSKSSYPMRVKRCQDIYARAKLMSGKLNKFLQDATKLTDRLLELCNKPVEPMIPTLCISQHFKPLQRLLDDRNFSEILLPLQTLMTVTLPSSAEVSTSHDPFPDDAVYIKGIEDVVEVLPSLQRPKKVTLRGSDGKLYIMLCKPKDDLRKDARLMEFNQIVNKSLRKDPESRRRELQIRTYTVTPLNEECGMLEWVTHTCSLRAILLNLYREKGMITTGKELRTMQVASNAPLEKKLDMYRKQLLPRHPPIFSDWFLRTFPDPTSWYTARLSYCRTAAVMSMVGYILGLGDRHGENILLDSTTGDCVHVDFNCLFNKGETFDYPEIVPFRLTHNMVDAMGPMGIEGVFRRACEVTLRVMRDECDPLMSVLRTFVYDPLVEWSKPARGRSNPTDTGEVKNEKAFTHVQNIESRLKGILKNKTKPLGLPLSVEGQCNHLIKEATFENNLCQMYIGWAAYL